MKTNPFYYSVGTRVRDRAFLKFLHPMQGEKILDVGCGLGYFAELLGKAGAELTGIDADDKCIDYCKANIKGEFRLEDIRNLPYADNYFDKVLCTEVLEHVNKNEEVLNEIKRVIKPYGTIVVSVPCSEGIFKAFFKNIGHNSVDGNSREYHWHKGYSYDEICHLLNRYQFATNGDREYTLVAGVEAFMGLTKIVIRLLRAKKIDSQANAIEVEKTLLWKVYTRLFPVIWWFAKLEQPLSRYLKGHMIIVKGTCVK